MEGGCHGSHDSHGSHQFHHEGHTLDDHKKYDEELWNEKSKEYIRF